MPPSQPLPGPTTGPGQGFHLKPAALQEAATEIEQILGDARKLQFQKPPGAAVIGDAKAAEAVDSLISLLNESALWAMDEMAAMGTSLRATARDYTEAEGRIIQRLGGTPGAGDAPHSPPPHPSPHPPTSVPAPAPIPGAHPHADPGGHGAPGTGPTPAPAPVPSDGHNPGGGPRHTDGGGSGHGGMGEGDHGQGGSTPGDPDRSPPWQPLPHNPRAGDTRLVNEPLTNRPRGAKEWNA